jgi:DNA-binding SARP family transcriptional activator/tetratricopeptide (TPR) repeat protein
MGTGLEFRLWGPVEAWSAGRRVELGQPRQRGVMAVLLTEANQVVSAGTLIERVWGDQQSASARSALYSYLTRIKTILRRLPGSGELVRLTRASGGYLFEVDPDAVDLHRFNRLVNRASTTDDVDQAAATWAQALRLCRGTPYEGLTSPWLDQMRDMLEQRRLTAVLDRNDVELARGRHADLLAELSDLSEQEPFDERLAGQLMLAAFRCGRQAEALGHYETMRRRLATELGVDPGTALSTLHQKLLQNDPGLAAPPAPKRTSQGSAGPRQAGMVPAQLPRDASGFTGRLDALASLDALLADAASQPTAVVISAVSGAAGVGKTALAIHWAHRVADRFPDGQLYVDLRGFDPDGRVTDPGEALRAFLEVLGVPPERVPPTVDEQAALYRSLLAGKRTLVVLDNARDADQVRPLLPGTATCVAVVTSRNQLTPLVAIDGARLLTLDVLSAVESRELLARRLGAARVTADPGAVEAIITACARLPLALAIAAGRAQQTGFPLPALAAELNPAGRLDVLDAGDAGSQIRGVFSWSYTALTAPAARLFRLLGLHPGPDISTSAAASLAGRPEPETRRLLAELTRANLLAEHAPGRFTSHDLLRAYAADLTHTHDTAEQRDAATTRMLDHYTHTACAADRLLSPRRDPIRLPVASPSPGTRPESLASHDQAMDWMSTEHQVLLAVLRYARDAMFDAYIWQLAWALDTFLDRRGRWHDLAAAWEAALPAAQRLGDPAVRAETHRRLGRVNIRLENHATAHAHIQHALDLYTETGDLTGQAHAHHSLGYLSEREGRTDLALEHSRQKYRLFQAAGHRRGQALGLNGIGWYLALLGEHARALTYCGQALAIFQQLGDKEGEAPTWDSLGYAHHHLHQYAQAAECYRQALALRRGNGTRYNEATTLVHLGDTHRAAGDHTAARAAWHQALDILTELHHPDTDPVRAKLQQLDPQPAGGKVLLGFSQPSVPDDGQRRQTYPKDDQWTPDSGSERPRSSPPARSQRALC